MKRIYGVCDCFSGQGREVNERMIRKFLIPEFEYATNEF